MSPKLRLDSIGIYNLCESKLEYILLAKSGANANEIHTHRPFFANPSVAPRFPRDFVVYGCHYQEELPLLSS